MRYTLSTGEDATGITQDPMTSIVETPLLRGLAAPINSFSGGCMIDCPPRRLVSTVFVKTSDAWFPPRLLCRRRSSSVLQAHGGLSSRSMVVKVLMSSEDGA